MTAPARIVAAGLALLLGSVLASLPGPAAAQPVDYGPLKEAQARYVETYNRQDAEGMAQMFAEDAHFVGVIVPQWFIGRKRILAAWEYLFEQFPAALVEVYRYEDSERQLSPVGVAATEGGVFGETGCLIMHLKRTPDDPGVRMLTRYDRTWLCDAKGCQIIRMHDSMPGGEGKLEEPLDDRDACFTE